MGRKTNAMRRKNQGTILANIYTRYLVSHRCDSLINLLCMCMSPRVVVPESGLSGFCLMYRCIRKLTKFLLQLGIFLSDKIYRKT